MEKHTFKNNLFRKLIFAWAALSALAMFTAQAQTTTIYRWVDANGTVHFSQNQPSVEDYIEIVVRGSASAVTEEIQQSTPVKPATSDLAQTLQTQANEYCQKAKANLTILQQHEQVKNQLDDGSQQLLSEEQKQQQIALAIKQIEIFCHKTDDAPTEPEAATQDASIEQ